MIHVSIEFYAMAIFKRNANSLILSHPFTQFNDRGFVGSEVYKTMSGKYYIFLSHYFTIFMQSSRLPTR